MFSRFWNRKASKSKSKTAQPVRGRKAKKRSTLLTMERLEERTLLSTVGSDQIWNLGNQTNSPLTVYFKDDPSGTYIQYRTDNSTYNNLQTIAGTGPITINPQSIANVVQGATDFVFSGSIFTKGRDLDVSAPGSITVKQSVILSTQNLGFTLGGAVSQGNSGA